MSGVASETLEREFLLAPAFRCGVCVHVCLCISIVRGMCSSGIDALSNLITANTIHFAFVNFVNTLT